MAENNLNNDPNVNNFLSSLNAVFSAFRGTLAPRNNAGRVRPSSADLGSPTFPWRRLYVDELVAGGEVVDLASIAVSAATYVFDATDANFAWPGSQTKCMVLAGSTTEIPGQGSSTATTVTVGGTTVSTGNHNAGEFRFKYRLITGISQGAVVNIQIAAGSDDDGFAILFAY